MDKEIWKDIPNYNGLYQVSSLGRVKSFKLGNEKILKQNIDSRGYYMVHLYNNGKSKGSLIHQLVAICFLNHIPNGRKLVVDHINDNKLDNKVENLQIVTIRFNSYKTQDKYVSKYKGVSWHKRSKKWQSRIEIDGKRKHLGQFTDEHEASIAYQNALIKYNLN